MWFWRRRKADGTGRFEPELGEVPEHLEAAEPPIQIPWRKVRNGLVAIAVSAVALTFWREWRAAPDPEASLGFQGAFEVCAFGSRPPAGQDPFQQLQDPKRTVLYLNRPCTEAELQGTASDTPGVDAGTAARSHYRVVLIHHVENERFYVSTVEVEKSCFEAEDSLRPGEDITRILVACNNGQWSQP